MPCRLFVKASNLGNDNVILLPRILGWNMLERRGPPIATHLIPEGWLLFDVNFTPAFSLANPRPPSPLDEKSSSAPHALDRALDKKRKGSARSMARSRRGPNLVKYRGPFLARAQTRPDLVFSNSGRIRLQARRCPQLPG